MEWLDYEGLSYFKKKIDAFLSNKVDKIPDKQLSTNDYTTAEKTKLSNIAEGANNYVHPTYTAKNSGMYKITINEQGHVSAATAIGKSDITGLGIPAQDTIYSVMKPATASTAGDSGLVPAPEAGRQDQFLRGDGI